MFKVKDEEVNSVLESCSEQIEELVNEYKILKNIGEFEPVVKVYPIADEGFIAFIQDADEEPLASILCYEGYAVYTAYGRDRDLMN